MKKKPRDKLPSNFDLDMVMALRCAYYVHTVSILPDHLYDQMESEYELMYGKLPVGSSNKQDYTEAQRALCMYFLFSNRTIKNPLL